MLIATVKFDKKKLVLAVILAALVLIGVILLVGAQQKAAALRELEGGARVTAVRDDKSAAAYLRALGWEVETPARSRSTVLIPRVFSAVFEEYNELQKQQGFDLSQCSGEEIEMYTYRVTNTEFAGEEVLAVLYVKNGSVVGGDIHTTALDGFMRGIRN